MASLDGFVGDNYSEDLASKRAPDGKTVAWFHRESDVDQGEFSMHHTLGQGAYQASPGNHNHDGRNSPYLSQEAFGPGGGGGEGIVAFVPTGVVLPFAADTPPVGYLLCDGSAVSRVDYSRLYDLIGDTYGAGDGSTTFNVPNLKGRVPMGQDTGQAQFDTLGETGGTVTHRHDFRIALFDNNYSAAGGQSGMRSTGDADRAGAYRYSTGSYSGAGGPDISPSIIRANPASSSAGTSGRHFSTGDTDTAETLPPYIVLSAIIKT